MIVEVVVSSYENYTPLLFEIDENNVDVIKQKIFEAFKEAHYKIKKTECWDLYYPSTEDVIISQEFMKAMENRGFKKVEPKIRFVFWGWNSCERLWVDESDELDKEMWKFVCNGDKNNEVRDC